MDTKPRSMRPSDELLDPSSQLRFCWARAFPQIPKSHDKIMGWLMTSHGMKWSEANRLPIPDVIELLKVEIRQQPTKAGGPVEEPSGILVHDQNVA